MTQPKFHIAQINIAAMRFALDHAEMAPFVAQLVRINALADGAPGFVWRLQDDSGDATAIKAYGDENILINMSVWSRIEDLFEYSYRSAHAEVLRARKQWFARPEAAALALWWVQAVTCRACRKAWRGSITCASTARARILLPSKSGFRRPPLNPQI